MVCSIVLPKNVRTPSPTSLCAHGNSLAILTKHTNKQRFKKEGCPNCEEYLHLQGSEEAVEACTSSVFEGLIAMADPGRSWVAKWQRIDGYVRGIYATKVMGQLPEEVVTGLAEDFKIRYMPYVLYIYTYTHETSSWRPAHRKKRRKILPPVVGRGGGGRRVVVVYIC